MKWPFFFREKRESELESFMKKKYNRLGTKIQQRTSNMNSLKTNEDLVLEWLTVVKPFNLHHICDICT